MAYFDAERGEVVLRVVYDGLATAGKTANLRALHAAFTARALGDLIVPAETATGRTLFFDWLELSAGYVDDWPLRCQVLSVPGQLVFAERRFRLLCEIDAVILVSDSTPKGVDAARIAIVFLEQALRSSQQADVPIVVQANKQDLPDALAPSEIARRLDLDRDRPVIAATAITGEGVRETLLCALQQSRERARHILRQQGPTALSPRFESAERVHAALLAGDGDGDERAGAALEAALLAAEK